MFGNIFNSGLRWFYGEYKSENKISPCKESAGAFLQQSVLEAGGIGVLTRLFWRQRLGQNVVVGRQQRGLNILTRQIPAEFVVRQYWHETQRSSGGGILPVISGAFRINRHFTGGFFIQGIVQAKRI